jgi:hypothetical protein
VVFEKYLKNSKHVVIIEEDASLLVQWGGFSQVRAMKLLLEKGTKIANNGEKLIFVSGQDYLLKPTSFLSKYLSENADTEFARYFLIQKKHSKHYNQIKRLNFQDVILLKKNYGSNRVRIINGLWRRFLKIFFYPLTVRRLFIPRDIAFGSNWIAISKECASYLLKMNTKKLDRQLRYTLYADEKYFQTLISRSPFHQKTPSKGYEVKNIDPELDRYPMLHHLRPNLHPIFDHVDREELLNSPFFLVRKVSLPESVILLDELDLKIKNEDA